MFSHLDESNRPTMVDVGAKNPTRREAAAQAIVRLPKEVLVHFKDDEITGKKGPVFQTAIIAGIMACKKTSELIPLCHPLALDDCKIRIHLNERREAVIECRVSCHQKTGVEMEALTGATIAALTLYDMCKSMSHDIVIGEVRLLEKTGGKSDVKAGAQNPVLARDPAD
ncbi:MAG: molybdenum cofactor biosynthesis protein [Fibrobacteres bacterium]|nr:molybdenum cofactor biosynthesis protein [Fibrobacterota bacterium]